MDEPRTVFEFMQREWDKQCAEAGKKKPYPEIPERQRRFIFSLVGWLQKEVETGRYIIADFTAFEKGAMFGWELNQQNVHHNFTRLLSKPEGK